MRDPILKLFLIIRALFKLGANIKRTLPLFFFFFFVLGETAAKNSNGTKYNKGYLCKSKLVGVRFPVFSYFITCSYFNYIVENELSPFKLRITAHTAGERTVT